MGIFCCGTSSSSAFIGRSTATFQPRSKEQGGFQRRNDGRTDADHDARFGYLHPSGEKQTSDRGAASNSNTTGGHASQAHHRRPLASSQCGGACKAGYDRRQKGYPTRWTLQAFACLEQRPSFSSSFYGLPRASTKLNPACSFFMLSSTEAILSS